MLEARECLERTREILEQRFDINRVRRADEMIDWLEHLFTISEDAGSQLGDMVEEFFPDIERRELSIIRSIESNAKALSQSISLLLDSLV